ncbi:MAG: HigA family addiction module antitoxin [Paracoccaceae bacterium]
MSKSPTTIEPVHPGEVLKEEFLAEYGLSATAFARRLGVPANRITRLINGEQSVTADTAVMLSAALGTSAEFWLNLQTQHDLERSRADPALTRRAREIEPILPHPA